mmetsp:Transcript_17732/g.49494  ORF Transcript_17732/g.49494 Transcript_17732/m.49494 type:complete len:204 (-) Transcript_17732:1223-1834(-)
MLHRIWTFFYAFFLALLLLLLLLLEGAHLLFLALLLLLLLLAEGRQREVAQNLDGAACTEQHIFHTHIHNPNRQPFATLLFGFGLCCSCLLRYIASPHHSCHASQSRTKACVPTQTTPGKPYPMSSSAAPQLHLLLLCLMLLTQLRSLFGRAESGSGTEHGTDSVRHDQHGGSIQAHLGPLYKHFHACCIRLRLCSHHSRTGF